MLPILGLLPARHHELPHVRVMRCGSIINHIFILFIFILFIPKRMEFVVAMNRMADWQHGQYIRGVAGLLRDETHGGRGAWCWDVVNGETIAVAAGHYTMMVGKPTGRWGGSYIGRYADLRQAHMRKR